MDCKEFFKRAEKQFEKLGITKMEEFAEIIGYSKKHRMRNFYSRGVTKRAIVSLKMIETLTKEAIDDLCL